MPILGDDHSNTKELLDLVLSYSPNFRNQPEKRTSVGMRGQLEEETITIKQQIQKEVLNKIQQLAKDNEWHKGLIFPKPWGNYSYGVKGYVDEPYLKKQLSNLASLNNSLKIAQGLAFEAICLGVMSQDSQDKNRTCVLKFVKTYPHVILELRNTHPEYFVDQSILDACLIELVIAQMISEEQVADIQGQGESTEYGDNASLVTGINIRRWRLIDYCN